MKFDPNASDSTTISFGYDTADRLISRAYPNGVTSTYEYDDMSRLKRLKDVNTAATLFDRQYQYNTANQISQVTEPSLTRVFGYDNVNRLTGVTNGGTAEAYSYDNVGNRTSSHLSTTYGYQSGQFNQLNSTTSATMRYDPNGNLVQKSEGSNFWQYRWDHENRLTEAGTRKTKAGYKYDALGRRVRSFQIGGTENTKFTYDGLDVLVDDNAGTLTKYLNGEGMDNKLRSTTDSTPSYFLADHLGSTNGLADSTGALSSQTSYDSFGNPTASLATRYGFTGREHDGLSGLMYYRARFYDPKLGRFISEDPVGFAGGDINLYGYVLNRPNMLRDPSGKAIPVIVVGGVALVALILASPSPVNAPGPGDPIYYPDNPLILNAAGGAACGYLINRFATPLISRLLSGAADDVVFPSAPVGHSGKPLQVAIPGQPPVNSPAVIGGRPFSGHALDQMQGRGIFPTVVDNTIRIGVPSGGNQPGTIVLYDATNNISVVVNSTTGRVITVSQGSLR